MSITAADLARFLIASLVTIALLLPAGWGTLALWFQTTGSSASKRVASALWIFFSLAVLVAVWQGRIEAGLAAFAVVFACLIVWWRRIEPSNDRAWADDVAKIAQGSVQGDSVEIRNVRNFEWHTAADYFPRWETRRYRLDHLRSTDMILSYWSGRAIAHMLVSFGFDDGGHVAFSVEIRRKRNEAFSEIGGFFKEFELSIIAADERDVVRLRTNVRGEDAYLYNLRIPPEAMRSLLLGYLDEASSLAAAPRFYNTITANCTTLVYHMMKRIVGYLPIDARLLFTGYLPGYVYRVGGLDSRYSLADLRERGRITERARRADGSATFSADIRRGVPDGT